MSDDDWAVAAAADEVGEDAPAVAHVFGQEIALYKIGDAFYATSNICTHGLARLSDGYLDGFLIECPLHQGLFDVRDGRCAGDPVDIDLATFELRVSEGMIEVRPR